MYTRGRHGVRMRSAAAAATVVAVASVLTGVALVFAAHFILLDNVDQAAAQRAEQVAAALGDAAVDTIHAAIKPTPRDRTVVQVLDAAGRVVAGSAAVGEVNPMSPLRPAAGVELREERKIVASREDPFRIAAVGVATPHGTYVVLAGQSIEEVDEGTGAAIAAVLIGMPLLTLIVGAATFLFVGRSLRPVDAMRRQAEAITASSLHTRLPVPAATDEISALATTMNTMLDRIETAAAARRRFVADASHELRSPLSTIHTGLDLLRTDQLPAGSEAHVARLRRESKRLARLIDDLVLLARVDESGLHVRQEDVDLDDLVYAERDRIASVRPQLTVESSIRPARVSGDPHHLQRALRNVVDNAVRHARHRVSLGLAPVAGAVEIVVGDDGPGIPSTDRERVFDRFLRLDEDRSRAGGGAGLGLPITRDIIIAHGGTVTVTEAPGGGTSLRIRLPLPEPGWE
jgi:signal transduction histidine kinase